MKFFLQISEINFSAPFIVCDFPDPGAVGLQFRPFAAHRGGFPPGQVHNRQPGALPDPPPDPEKPTVQINHNLSALQNKTEFDPARVVNKNALPDVYMIVLDSYAREDILKQTFNYDNQPFLA